jgi:hypothetical protein
LTICGVRRSPGVDQSLASNASHVQVSGEEHGESGVPARRVHAGDLESMRQPRLNRIGNIHPEPAVGDREYSANGRQGRSRLQDELVEEFAIE